MIEVQQVQKKYGRKPVLRDITFTAEKGEITCLIGINGVGKTTIMKAIMGLTPYKGQILIDGKSISKASYNHITFVPDRLTMPGHMTIASALDFMSDFYTAWNTQRAEELLQFFRLHKTDRLGDLSKGNAAKLNMLLGLALDVDYILMDEPFSGIDMFSREQITEVFTSHLVENRGVLLTTHEIQDIEHLIDKAVFIDDGRVIKEIRVEETREIEGKSVVDVMREVYIG
jgi:ABC-2 type transport system ATP-binding protein